MTEQEWLTATDPMAMLEFLLRETSDRKLRHFENALDLSLGFRESHQSTDLARDFASNQTEQDVRLLGDNWTPAYESACLAVGQTDNLPRESRLLRDIFGNPFRPVTLDRSRLNPTVTNLAQTIYDDRQMPSGLFDTQRLGILADALEEAGCDNTDILGHLRECGDHVRGCWAVDLILGKS